MDFMGLSKVAVRGLHMHRWMIIGYKNINRQGEIGGRSLASNVPQIIAHVWKQFL